MNLEGVTLSSNLNITGQDNELLMEIRMVNLDTYEVMVLFNGYHKYFMSDLLKTDLDQIFTNWNRHCWTWSSGFELKVIYLEWWEVKLELSFEQSYPHVISLSTADVWFCIYLWRVTQQNFVYLLSAYLVLPCIFRQRHHYVFHLILIGRECPYTLLI